MEFYINITPAYPLDCDEDFGTTVGCDNWDEE
jgi:hypothetical protein